MRVGIAYNAFAGAFAQHYKNLELIKTTRGIDKYDLIIFPGGEDINPRIYGNDNDGSYGISDSRDSTEINLWRNYSGKVLGVCRGHQLITAMMGGYLIQDLRKTGKPHLGDHEIKFTNNSIFDGVFPGNIVNSYHHQGVPENTRVRELIPTAIHKDVIEIFESNRIITVQFHPEFMDYALGKRFFDVINKWVKNEISIKAKVSKDHKIQSFDEYVGEKLREHRGRNSQVVEEVPRPTNPNAPSRISTYTWNPTVDFSTSTANYGSTVEEAARNTDEFSESFMGHEDGENV